MVRALPPAASTVGRPGLRRPLVIGAGGDVSKAAFLCLTSGSAEDSRGNVGVDRAVRAHQGRKLRHSVVKQAVAPLTNCQDRQVQMGVAATPSSEEVVCMRFHRRCSRLALTYVIAVSLIAVVAPAASANQAGRIVPSGFTIRGVRSQIYHQTTWELPSAADLETMWIGAQANIGSGPEIAQDGLMKANTHVQGCGGLDTGGVVKTFYYWINTSNRVLDCIFGQNVSKGEKHTFKVQRCNNSNSQWCTFIDGTQVGQPRDIGLSTAPWADALGEYDCSCGAFSDDIDGSFGGSDAANKWDITDCGTDCSNPTWTTIQNSNAQLFDNSCPGHGLGGPATSNWQVDTVNAGNPWNILSFLPIDCT